MGRKVLMVRLVGNVLFLQLFMCPLSASSIAAPQDECSEGSCPSQGRSQIQINSRLPPLENIQVPSSQKKKSKTELDYELWSKTCACGISKIAKLPQKNESSNYYNDWADARNSRRDAFKEYIEPNSSIHCVVNMATGEQECYTPSWDILIHDTCFDLCWNTFMCPCMVTEACRCILESCKGCDFCNSSQAIRKPGNTTDEWYLNPYGPEYDPGNRSLGESGLNMCPEWNASTDLGRGFDEEDLKKANCQDSYNNRDSNGYCDGIVNVSPYEYPWDPMNESTYAAYEEWLHNSSHVPWSEVAYSFTH